MALNVRVRPSVSGKVVFPFYVAFAFFLVCFLFLVSCVFVMSCVFLMSLFSLQNVPKEQFPKNLTRASGKTAVSWAL